MLKANWCGLAAIGAGLILFAVAAGAALPAALPLGLLACAEIVWGALSVRAGRIVLPRVAAIVCVTVMGAATVALMGRMIGLAPFLALLALHWSTAILIALEMRGLSAPSARQQRRRPAPPRTSVLLVVLAAEAMLVAAITTPALAQTGPGASAVPHGSGHVHSAP